MGSEHHCRSGKVGERNDGLGAKACWFVGSSFGGSNDQTKRFIEEGIWENGCKDRYLELVRSIQPGDRIAIKSSYTRKHGLPFDNRGHSVSVLGIKAAGTVQENLGDGRKLKVDWTPFDPPREWYFYTYQGTVWNVSPGEWPADALIAFAFENQQQDIDRFRNSASYRERFGDGVQTKQRFAWTRFFEEVADKLCEFKDNRPKLIAGLHQIASRVNGLSILNDQFSDGTIGPLRDICPFTTMGVFNRGITMENRRAIAGELASFLSVAEPVPDSFEGVPILNNQNSWFFGYDRRRQHDDIDALWKIFTEAIQLADAKHSDERESFVTAYDDTARRRGVGWNLTMGLFWIRPWAFMTLDGKAKPYIENELGIRIDRNGPKRRCTADDYLGVLDKLKTRFLEETFPVHSFPELSHVAWLHNDEDDESDDEDGEVAQQVETVTTRPTSPPHEAIGVPYSLDDIVSDGCFLSRSKLEEILDRLRIKKNLILQGPPGTGKTWLAKRLGYALLGQQSIARMRAVQFHPNLSYEDFVRGWRPGSNGKLSMVDGPFMEMIAAASGRPDDKHVVVIEEINRGNPAQVFGELLTLLEADKRSPSASLELCYRRHDGERVFVPENLFVIGTMNIADRSLALVDLALRRRFSFIDLDPVFDQPWRNWLTVKCEIATDVVGEIESRIKAMNEEIAADRSLGPQFRIGHSYLTPPLGKPIRDARVWYRQVVETEIGPLLEEYWFDAVEKAHKARAKLLEGF
ncbi:MAG: AAA family ATPase [Phycisphaerales bacterium]|nr:AAA family ATPase [Phycisphaerales bacterium]MCB9864865.1 AAA family ATPase [Phycisphaerales bacterium]